MTEPVCKLLTNAPEGLSAPYDMNQKYYILSPDPELPFIYGKITFSPDDQGVYSNLWHDRKLPDGLTAKAELEKPKRKLARDLFSLNAGFIGTKNFLDLLKMDHIKADVNPYPCNVFQHTGEKIDGDFYFLEFNCWLDVFDYAKSVYTVDHELINKVTSKPIINSCKKLVLSDIKSGLPDIFFIENSGFFDPVISERLAMDIRDKKIKGIILTPVDEYTWSD